MRWTATRRGANNRRPREKRRVSSFCVLTEVTWETSVRAIPIGVARPVDRIANRSKTLSTCAIWTVVSSSQYAKTLHRRRRSFWAFQPFYHLKNTLIQLERSQCNAKNENDAGSTARSAWCDRRWVSLEEEQKEESEPARTRQRWSSWTWSAVASSASSSTKPWDWTGREEAWEELERDCYGWWCSWSSLEGDELEFAGTCRETERSRWTSILHRGDLLPFASDTVVCNTSGCARVCWRTISSLASAWCRRRWRVAPSGHHPDTDTRDSLETNGWAPPPPDFRGICKIHDVERVRVRWRDVPGVATVFLLLLFETCRRGTRAAARTRVTHPGMNLLRTQRSTMIMMMSF